MTLLTRYLLRHFLTLMAVVGLGLLGLFLLVEIFERLDDFVEAHAKTGDILLYFLFRLPGLLDSIAPLIILMAGLVSISILARQNELMILKTSGISPWQIARPHLAAVGLISALLLFLSGFIAPQTESMASAVRENKPRHGMVRGDRLFYHGERNIWSALVERPDASVLSSLHWMRYDENYHIMDIIHAKHAEYAGKGRWNLFNGVHQTREITAQPLRDISFKSMSLESGQTPRDFMAVETPPHNMKITALYTAIRRMKQAGLSTAALESVFWSRLTYPLLGLAMLFAGLPIVLAVGRGGIPFGISFGIALGFLVWIAWNFLFTLEGSGRLHPGLGPAIVLSALLIMGTVMFKRLRF